MRPGLLSIVFILTTIPLLGSEGGGGLVQIFKTRCIRCHGDNDTVKGKVNLLEIQGPDDWGTHPDLMEQILQVVKHQEMPPEDEPPLSNAERTEIISTLKALRANRAASYPQAPIRRMNRFQYNNAVVDLFKLDGVVFALPEKMLREHRNYFQPETGRMAEHVTVGSRPLGKSQLIEKRLSGVAPFPQDLRAEHGFDNRADHLSLSPLLMEAFLKLGQSVVESNDFNPGNVGVWDEFFTQPDDSGPVSEVVRKRLEPFLTRAFRRAITPPVLDRYMGYVLAELGRGTPFTSAMKSVASAAISSPWFLYLSETSGPSGGAEPLDDYELANRLSWFLWGSLPDRALLELAAMGRLSDPEVLTAEFERMIRDQRLKRFCDSFPAQWLQLERIISSTPNREQYPDFYFLKYRDSMHMMVEPLLIFETVLIENRPITQLIDSDFTYRSSLLEEAYGELALSELPEKVRNEVVVLNFKRIPVTDRRSGGVITNAGIMTMTSGPERTQPITRGAWLATVIFNDPPDPPPADVPPLGEKPAAGEENLTLRERLAAHRERADCRGCHEKIDPLGFALENYGPIGNWRDQYHNGRRIDVSGTLFRRHRFDAIDEFKDALLAEKDRFTRGLAGHLLSFALARELGADDQPVLDRIAAVTAADGYRIQTLLREVVLSEPFRTKTNPEKETRDEA